MGWETLAIVGFQAVAGAQGISQAKKQGHALTREGEYAAQTAADNTIRSTGKLQTSFLQSGLTLEGGPMDVLKQAFSKGYTDIGRIKQNADAGAKNLISSARTKALQNMASSAAGGSMGSAFGNFAGDLGAGFSSFGQGYGFGTGYDLSQTIRGNSEIF